MEVFRHRSDMINESFNKDDFSMDVMYGLKFREI